MYKRFLTVAKNDTPISLRAAGEGLKIGKPCLTVKLSQFSHIGKLFSKKCFGFLYFFVKHEGTPGSVALVFFFYRVTRTCVRV
jgi:hypothetical protein